MCENCLEENWDACPIEGWVAKNMAVKGKRNPNAKHIDQQMIDEPLVIGDDEWEVLSIQGQRVKHGVVEYLIEWKGYDKMTWLRGDKLNADEILEDWEIANNME